MLVSGLLVAASLAAFLWLAGVLEWRGSSGNISIDVTLQCGTDLPSDISSVAFLNLEESNVEVDIWSETNDLKTICPKARIRLSRMPESVVSAGTVDAPGDDEPIAATFSSKSIGYSPPLFEALISTVDRLRLRFVDGKIPRYTGLGEQDISLHLDISIAPEKGTWTSPTSRTLQIRPPEGFYVATSRPPASFSENDIWTIDLAAHNDQAIVNPAVEVSFKNERLSRLDHIIDSSIAAVLGVGAGGIISAWLALRIARTKSE
jgi:hypothetical protein